MHPFWNRLLDLLFPPHCVFCDALLERSSPEPCPVCREQLPWIAAERSCQKGQFVSRVVSAFWYEGCIRDSIQRYKFRGQRGYAVAYAPLLATYVRRELSDAYDIISWMPVSEKRRKTRGYDQARLLAEAVAVQLGEKAVPTLRKTRDNPAQSSLSAVAARQRNVAGIYAPVGEVTGKRILLIDDVRTTGATLEEGAKTLLEAHAGAVVAATFCRTRSHPNAPKEESENQTVEHRR